MAGRDVSELTGERLWKAVYTIVERGPEKRFWIRIGTAWINRDQSIHVKLDASPTNGQLHIRDPDPASRPTWPPRRPKHRSCS